MTNHVLEGRRALGRRNARQVLGHVGPKHVVDELAVEAAEGRATFEQLAPRAGEQRPQGLARVLPRAQLTDERFDVLLSEGTRAVSSSRAVVGAARDDRLFAAAKLLRLGQLLQELSENSQDV